MRPCGTVLRKILAVSIPGSRIVWVYSARPLTLACASSRGTERPICLPATASVIAILVRRSYCATDIDAQQFAFIGGRAAQIADDHRFGCFCLARTPQHPVIDGGTR